MSRQYPRYAGKVRSTRPMKPTDLCEACAAPAMGWVEVQWTWSRSDDEHYKVCDEHRKQFRTNTETLAKTIEANRRKALENIAQGKPGDQS